MKARLLHTLRAASSAPDEICVVEDGIRYVPEGAVIDNPNAHLLVHGGHAEAADEECEEAVKKLDPSLKGEMRRKHDAIMRIHREAQEELIDQLMEEEEEEEDDE